MHSISVRRKNEEAARKLQASVKDYQDLEAKIKFANKILDQPNRPELPDDELEVRRSKLRARLVTEENEYLEMISSAQETPEERNRRLAEQARRLKADRERERQEFISQALRERDLAACDEARASAAKQAAVDNAAVLLKQIEEKRLARSAQEKEEQVLETLYQREHLKQLEREDKEQRQRQAQNNLVKIALDTQISQKASRAKTVSDFAEEVYFKGERESLPAQRVSPCVPKVSGKVATLPTPGDAEVMAEAVRAEKQRLLAEIAVQQEHAARMREYIEEHERDRQRRVETDILITTIQEREAERQATVFEQAQVRQARERQVLLHQVYSERSEQVKGKVAKMESVKQEVAEDRARLVEQLDRERLQSLAEQELKAKRAAEYRSALLDQIRTKPNSLS